MATAPGETSGAFLLAGNVWVILMAKRPTKRPSRQRAKAAEPSTPAGPYVQIAAICQTLLSEGIGDGSVHSLIRLTEAIRVERDPTEVPTRIEGTMFVLVKRGTAAKDNHVLELEGYRPDGTSLKEMSVPIELPRTPSGGAALSIKLGIKVDALGLYAFDIRLNGKFATRLYLNVQVGESDIHDAAVRRR